MDKTKFWQGVVVGIASTLGVLAILWVLGMMTMHPPGRRHLADDHMDFDRDGRERAMENEPK